MIRFYLYPLYPRAIRRMYVNGILLAIDELYMSRVKNFVSVYKLFSVNRLWITR